MIILINIMILIKCWRAKVTIFFDFPREAKRCTALTFWWTTQQSSSSSSSFSGTKFFRYRFRDFSPVPFFSHTGSDTTKKMKNSRYRYVTLWSESPSPSCHLHKYKGPHILADKRYGQYNQVLLCRNKQHMIEKKHTQHKLNRSLTRNTSNRSHTWLRKKEERLFLYWKMSKMYPSS